MNKFAVIHPVLSGALTRPSEALASEELAALELRTGLPGFVRVIPEPAPPLEPVLPRRRTRGRASLLARAER